MSEDSVASDLAVRLERRNHRNLVLAQKAVLDAETKKIKAPEMWARLRSFLKSSIERTNQNLESPLLGYNEHGNEIVITSSADRVRRALVWFSTISGYISFGIAGAEPNRFSPQIDGDCLVFEKGTATYSTEEEIAIEILSLL